MILLAAVTLWALNYSVMKYGISQIQPLALPVVRFGTAGLILLVVLRIHEGSVGVRRGDLPRLAIAGFFGVTLSQISFVFALTYTTASDNALIGATAPIVTVVIATIIGLERSGRRHWLAVLIGLIGVVLIVVGGSATGLFQSGLLGDALAFGNVLASSISAILIVPLLVRYSVYRILTYEMLIGTVLLLPLALPSIMAQDFTHVTIGGLGGAGLHDPAHRPRHQPPVLHGGRADRRITGRGVPVRAVVPRSPVRGRPVGRGGHPGPAGRRRDRRRRRHPQPISPWGSPARRG